MCCVVFFSCKKKTVQDNIPYQNVYIRVYPNDPLNFKLQVVGGWIYYNGGVNGLIIYRKTTVGANDFIALERTSTHLPDNVDARVKVQSDNFTLKDTISGSKWQIIDGAVTSGPATLPLRQYFTSFDSN
jgi:Rieske Fe-S protein